MEIENTIKFIEKKLHFSALEDALPANVTISSMITQEKEFQIPVTKSRRLKDDLTSAHHSSTPHSQKNSLLFFSDLKFQLKKNGLDFMSKKRGRKKKRKKKGIVAKASDGQRYPCLAGVV